ncbi:glycerophosphoryl diester phosphodiesterase membrane domain-containing protein [Streptococcus suis]|nr:glycerophosphoryl diester phosphodiesterase membrane domain-containing protein [Streptococcus suis]
MKKLNKYKLVYFGRIAWIYTKYQLLTKSILFFIIFPIFNLIIKNLIESTGRVSISSGDYLGFLFSLQGLAVLIVSIIILSLLIALDINALIIMSALIKENRIKLTARQLLLVGIKTIKSIFKPSGILVMIYIALVVPLVGIGLSVSVMDNFKIPNFITDVIFNNPIYFASYSAVITVLTITTIIYIFFFHYLIIDNQTVGKALRMSFDLMKKHWKDFIKKFLIQSGITYIATVTIVSICLYSLLLYSQTIEDIFFRRLWSIFISLSITEIFGYISIMTVPFICFRLTELFYQFNKKDGYDIHLKQNIKAEDIGEEIFRKVKFRTKFSILFVSSIILLINFSISVFLSVFFEDVFKPNDHIAIVAHRGGGDLAAENSISGMEKAAKNGAQWSEIDVQRTKDGHYIINHDATFSRVAGMNKKSIDLTLDEIKHLKITDLFNAEREAQPIATLEEFLDASKNKVKLFIELKGESADDQMADDVIRLVKERGLEKEIAILSLDYKLITYIEKKYPEIDTGYLYFFSIGETKKLVADILVMEEQEATPEKIEAIHAANKKAIVWTVNTDESIKKFVISDVDGIITDHVISVKEGIQARDNRTEIQIIIDSIIN